MTFVPHWCVRAVREPKYAEKQKQKSRNENKTDTGKRYISRTIVWGRHVQLIVLIFSTSRGDLADVVNRAQCCYDQCQGFRLWKGQI